MVFVAIRIDAFMIIMKQLNNINNKIYIQEIVIENAIVTVVATVIVIIIQVVVIIVHKMEVVLIIIHLHHHPQVDTHRRVIVNVLINYNEQNKKEEFRMKTTLMYSFLTTIKKQSFLFKINHLSFFLSLLLL